MEEEKYSDWESRKQSWNVKFFPYHDFMIPFWGYGKLKKTKLDSTPHTVEGVSYDTFRRKRMSVN